MRESAERAFQLYRRPLAMVTTLKYLGRVLTVADDNWLEVVGHLWKAQNSSAHLSNILGRYGASPRVSGIFSKAVVQAVLLFRLETWLLTPAWDRPWEDPSTGSPDG